MTISYQEELIYLFSKATSLFRKGRAVTMWGPLSVKEHSIPSLQPTKQVFQYSLIGTENPLTKDKLLDFSHSVE